MKTVGDFIKDQRFKNNISRVELGEMTHIKTNFIKAIEESKWEDLPELPVVIGFVKSISHFLDIDETEPVALLRRSYQVTSRDIKLKNQQNALISHPSKIKNIEKRFIWNPKLTFATLVVIILFFVFGYLIFQYQKFNAPPTLIINEPSVSQKVESGELKIIGKTDTDATVTINNQPVIVSADGSFQTTLEISQSTKSIQVIAKGRSGKVSTVSRTIEVQP
jgi:cytoskeletal protein RodZ